MTQTITATETMVVYGDLPALFTHRTDYRLWITEQKAVSGGWIIYRAESLDQIKEAVGHMAEIGPRLMILKSETGRDIGVSYPVKRF